MDDVIALFHRYKDPVYRLALSFTGSPADAEDVTQTVFLKYLETQPELEEGKERAWLLQVTANQCRDLWRRLRRRATVPLEEARAVAVLPPKVETVWETVKTLKPMDRGALYLFYYEGYSTGEIAQMLLASAYLPGFKREKIGGKYYTDGCRTNNVPVDVLIDRGYKDIIVIRIYGVGVDTEKHLRVPEDVRLYHIAPQVSLGGILEFDGRKARRNLALGYADARRLLYGS